MVMADVNNAEAEVLIKSELLCYIQNNFDKSPRENLIAAIIGFYSANEIEAAKGTLADIASDAVDEGALPGLTKKRTGNGKRKADTEDMLSIYEHMDKTSVMMPTFVAVKLKRVPSVSPSEVDVCALAANVNELQQQMNTMAEAIKTLVNGQNDLGASIKPLHDKWQGLSGASCAAVPVVTGTEPVAVTSVSKDDRQTQSWADQLTNVDADGFTQVRKPKPSKPSNNNSARRYERPPVKLVGKRAVRDGVRTVVRPLTCFVARLHIDTTEEELTNYLAESGIPHTKCTRIKPKDGRRFYTAAFRVSCDPQYRDIFYNEDSWPEGAELRDWVY